DNAPMGIWMVDPKGKVQFVNRVFCGATGISEERFLAADSYVDVLSKSVPANCIRSDQECMAQNTPHLSSECLLFVDGREHDLEITKVRLLDQNGKVRGLIGLAVDVTERREHEKQLERIAHYDALTGVPNRVLLADRLQQALARTMREGELMAVCYLDLDGFKPVNDRYGHEEGDRVLVEITRRIKSVIRTDDTVARLGGDEFVVLLVGMNVPDEYVGSLNRLLEAINQPIEIRGKQLQISASIGVSLYPDDLQDADTLLRHADQAMYIAKQAGKNRYHLFDAQHDQRTRTHNALLVQIRHGLENGEFELYYQPKVEMLTRRLCGAEALIRWNHPQRGLLPPGEFLRAIENTELDILLGEWVIRQALAQMRNWRMQGFDLTLSINISAYHLQAPDFVRKLQDEMGVFCPENCERCLQIEVLETVAIDDIANFGELIRECREIGVGFALDDFGTGYSSLTYLNRLDVDTLKIDQSFVRHMLEESGGRAIVQGIIALAHAFGREVVAEGVETEAHYQALVEMGCEIGQGYGIARPMPASKITCWSFPEK
ncbi:MAG: EAL domain-containing protein, partial [Gallionella sp.]|nr:EAL domain-containing protein [Gallionella sp.]